MSKLARTIQSTITTTNWKEMAKILFWGDFDQTRHNEVMRLHSSQNTSLAHKTAGASYTIEQSQYILVLMLILTTAEKRIQELYQRNFAQRCDSISDTYGLKEDQYWIEGRVPAEWEELDVEFERQSVRILQDTLREYSMDEIANHVEVAGAQQFYDMIETMQSQFLSGLRQPQHGMLKIIAREHGSVPEILQSSPSKAQSKRRPDAKILRKR